MAFDGGEHPFNESSLLALPNGRIVAMGAHGKRQQTHSS